LVIYPSISSLYESNIGSSGEDFASIPSVVLQGNRLLLAFTGSYKRLREDLSLALAELVWDQHFERSALHPGGTKLLPGHRKLQWAKPGMVSWFAGGWGIADEEELRQFFRFRPNANWRDILANSIALAGKAFCQYLELTFGEQSVRNLFTH